MDVTIAIATFGTCEWVQLAEERAIPSAKAQGVPVVHRHANTLAEARNAVLAEVFTEFVIHLDADDQLSPDYVEQMAKGSADLRAPAVSYVKNSYARAPYVPKVPGHLHDCEAECVASGDGNWLVVGTAARTQLLKDAGWWKPWSIYEDFDLWMRVLQRHATVEAIPEAVYIAHVNPQSRNRAPEMAFKNRIHHEIVRANLGEPQVAA